MATCRMVGMSKTSARVWRRTDSSSSSTSLGIRTGSCSLIFRTSYATTGARLSGGSRVPSAVYLPYLPPAFSPSVHLALSPSWLSLLPVLDVASPFRAPSSPAACLFRVLPSLVVCPALPSLLPAGAPCLRPPVRRPQYRRNRRKRLRAKPRFSSSLSSFVIGDRWALS